jgi:hypothetical protein
MMRTESCPASENEVIEFRRVQEFADFPADVQPATGGPEVVETTDRSR